MTEFLENAIQIMRTSGHRATPQRLLILQAIQEHGGHTTLEEIYLWVRKKAPHLHRATVYRSLDFLCDQRMVTACDSGNGRMVYELAGSQPHHHLICRKCGAVAVMENTEVQPFFDQIKTQHQFLIDMDHLALFGLCTACQNTSTPVQKGV